MSEITREELGTAVVNTGIGFAAGGPPGALLQGGLSLLYAAFPDPDEQANTQSRDQLPQEAFTSPSPVHAWSIIGQATMGGLVAYASSGFEGDGGDKNEVLHLALVLSKGSLATWGTSQTGWLNGRRVRWVRQTPSGNNPDKGTAEWYEPDFEGIGHNIFEDSWTAANGLLEREPVDGDLLFNKAAGTITQRRGSANAVIYTLPSNLSKPANFYIRSNPATRQTGDWTLRADGSLERTQPGINQAGQQSGIEQVEITNLYRLLFDSGRSWQGLLGQPFQSWQGRARLYTYFKADGTEGAELRNNSAQLQSFSRSLGGGFVETDIPEWTADHKLTGYSWVYVQIGVRRDKKLIGNENDVAPVEEDTMRSRRRAARLSGFPSIVFDNTGVRRTPNHPVSVARWLLKDRGLLDAQISKLFDGTITDQEGTADDGTTTTKYAFNGAVTDDQSVFELLRNLEFLAAGKMVLDSTGAAWLQQYESAPDYGELSDDDLLEGIESYDPQGRGNTLNTARMTVRHVYDTHPSFVDRPLPDVINTELLKEDGRARRDDLGTTEYVSDFNQGQWRLGLHALQLGLRGRATFRIEETEARKKWLLLGRLTLRSSQFGTLRGYVESIVKQLDGSLQIVMMVGDTLSFKVRPESEYRALAAGIPDPLEVAPPVEPAEVEDIEVDRADDIVRGELYSRITISFTPPPANSGIRTEIQWGLTLGMFGDPILIPRPDTAYLNAPGEFSPLETVHFQLRQALYEDDVRTVAGDWSNEFIIPHGFVLEAPPAPNVAISPTLGGAYLNPMDSEKVRADNHIVSATIRHVQLDEDAAEIADTVSEFTWEAIQPLTIENLEKGADYKISVKYVNLIGSAGPATEETITVLTLGESARIIPQTCYFRTTIDKLENLPALPTEGAGHTDIDRAMVHYVPPDCSTNFLIPTQEAPIVWSLSRIWSNDPAQLTEWMYAAIELRFDATVERESQITYYQSANLPVGDLPDISGQTDEEKTNKEYRPPNTNDDLETFTLTEEMPLLWELRRVWSNNASFATDWEYARIEARWVSPADPAVTTTFQTCYFNTTNQPIGDLPKLPTTGTGHTDEDRAMLNYLPPNCSVDIIVPTEENPVTWALTRTWSNDPFLLTEWGYAFVADRWIPPIADAHQQLFQEAYYLSESVQLSDLPDISGQSDEEKTNKGYRPPNTSDSILTPTSDKPDVWKLTRVWSTDVDAATDWRYAGIVRTFDSDHRQEFQRAYFLSGNVQVSDLPDISGQSNEEKTNQEYLPPNVTRERSTPTEDKPLLWELTRHWSTLASQASDWGYSQIVARYETTVLTQFQRAYFLSGNVQVSDLPDLSGQTDAQKTNRGYLPPNVTRGRDTPTEAKPLMWELTRTWSNDADTATEWAYSQIVDRYENVVLTEFQRAYFLSANLPVGDLPDLSGQTDAQKTNRGYLPPKVSRSRVAVTEANPLLWELTRTWSNDADTATEWGYSQIVERFDTTYQQLFQETYYLSGNVAVGDLPKVTGQSDEQKTDIHYRPANTTDSKPEPTEDKPLVWKLTRHWSTLASQASDWDYSGTVDRYESIAISTKPPAPTNVRVTAADIHGSFFVSWDSSGSFFTEIEWEYLESASYHFEARGTTYAQNFRVRTQQRSTNYRFRIRHRAIDGTVGDWYLF